VKLSSAGRLRLPSLAAVTSWNTRRTVANGIPADGVTSPHAVRVHRRPAVLVAAAIVVLAMMSSFVWWPSGTPRSVRAEAATVPTATPSTPVTSSAAPTPKTTTKTVDRPVARRTKPAAVPEAKPRPKVASKAEPKPKAVAKPVKKPVKAKIKKPKPPGDRDDEGDEDEGDDEE
jgi:outer membrane biosynthesis protein TonB